MGIIPENESTTESTAPNVARPGYTDCVDRDTFVLPECATVGLTREQVAEITAAAVESARKAPRLAPPAWVRRGPDYEGNYDGPTRILGDRSLHLSWSAHAGATMWLEEHPNAEEGLTPAGARELADALLTSAALMEQANAPTGEGGGVKRFMSDAERVEFDAALIADGAEFRELLQAPVELADRLSPVPSSFAAAATAGGAR